MKDYRPEPRLVITMSGGLITDIIADNIDLSGVMCFVIDEDTEGGDEQNVVNLAGREVYVQAHDINKATEDEHRIYGILHQNWMICE